MHGVRVMYNLKYGVQFSIFEEKKQNKTKKLCDRIDHCAHVKQHQISWGVAAGKRNNSFFLLLFLLCVSIGRVYRLIKLVVTLFSELIYFLFLPC